MDTKILLTYKFKKSVLELFQSKEAPIDERIIKLDQWNVIYGRCKEDTTMTSFKGDINRVIHMASIVVYKKDWDDPNCSLQVLRFRYPNADLKRYLELLKVFPIFVPHNNNKEYDWIRNNT
jgi:hypothetical protein